MAKIGLFRHTVDLEDYLAKAIAHYLEQHADSSILFLVSGGSARNVLEYIDEAVLGENITVSQVDERFSGEEGANNYLQLTHTPFYARAKACGVAFIPSLPEESESLETAARRWEGALRTWESAHPQSRIIIVLMGIGPDGHTAGIMPFPEDPDTFRDVFEDTPRWVVGYDAGKKNQYAQRMTTTISFLETKVDQAFLFVRGEEKGDILRTILSSRDIPTYPATVIHTMKQVAVYTTIECD